MSADCIFCKIANGEIPSKTIYEDADFRVILDIAPGTPGHALILPKSHGEDLFSLDDAVLQKVFPLAKRVAKAIMKATGAKGCNIVQNNGEVAGRPCITFMCTLFRVSGRKEILSLGTLPDMLMEKWKFCRKRL